MIEILDTVVLRRDLPAYGLRAGDLGAVVEVHDEGAFEVEFVAASGRTRAVVSVSAEDLRAVEDDDVVTVRAGSRLAAG